MSDTKIAFRISEAATLEVLNASQRVENPKGVDYAVSGET